MPNKKPRAKLTRQTLWEGAGVIIRHLKPHKRTVVLLVTLSLVAAIAEAFVPFLAGKIFDAIISISKNPLLSLTSIFFIVAIWFLLRLGSDIAEWKIGFSNERLGVMLEAEYIANGFGKLFEMPLSFHKTRKRGEIGEKISRAAGWLENLISRVSLNLLPSFLSIIVALCIAFFINHKLTLVLVLAIAIYAILLWRAVPRLAGLQQKMHRAYSRAYGDIYDALENIQEIKQAATESEEKRKIHRKFVLRAAPLWLRLSYIFRQLSFFQRLLIVLTQLAIFVISIFLVRSGTLTPGELVAFNGYAAMIFGPFVILGQNWQTIQNGFIALVQAEKILGMPKEIYNPKGAVAPKKLKGEVVFNNVSFAYYKTNDILKNVSFSVSPGEKIALVGKSGVGKTTIADLLLGFYFPQKGKILVDGTDIKKFNLTAYRLRFGVVPQEPTLFNDLIENNIRYGNFGKSEAEMKEASRLAHADEFIESFPKKYKQVVGWRGVKLSIGQKQRIALSRAFLRNPDILILDEPTSALDAHSEQFIKDSFRKLMASRTTFIIAHRLSTIREADKILVLQNGRIAEQGNHAELMKIKNGIYRGLYKLQAGFY